MIASHDMEELSRYVELFEGADTIITDDPERDDKRGFSVCTRVQTPHARPLSWLLLQLGEIFAEELDYMNKFYFYPELARSAGEALEKDGSDCKAMLNAVLDRAEKIEL